MLYLTTQIWMHLLLAFALGGGVVWWWARRRLEVDAGARAVGQIEETPADQPGLVESLRAELETARTEARRARDDAAAAGDDVEALRARQQEELDRKREEITRLTEELRRLRPAPTRSREGTPRLPDTLVARSELDAGTKDDLTMIRGVGPVLAGLLNDMGIHTFREIAGWSPDDIERVQSQLARFPNRIRKDDWVSQAAELDAREA